MNKKEIKFGIQIINYFLIVAFAFILIIQVFFPKKSVEIIGFQTYLVSNTGSMKPDLNYNDLIIIKKYDFNQLKVGDYISFISQTTDNKKMIITHQVNKIYNDSIGTRYIQTKGINTSFPDLTPVTNNGEDGTNDYLGKYIGKNELAGNIIAYFRSIIGLFLIIITITGATILYYFVIKNKEKMINK